jgi:redox-sensitive bicupin YhaK (pirin superfamily)
MSVQVRRSGERGFFDHGWLKTYHSFSFADYRDPKWMGFRSLRVINEDWVAPGEGFPTHSHRDMEIITYVLKGVLAHKDSMGNASEIKPGEVQRMSAGTGVTHSEFNHMSLAPVHLLQIWIMPEKRSLAPGYEQKAFELAGKRNTLRLVASPDGSGGSVKIHQDVRLYDSRLDAGQSVTHTLKPGRASWIQMISGSLRAGGVTAAAGDGLYTETAGDLKLEAAETAEFLLFDLA